MRSPSRFLLLVIAFMLIKTGGVLLAQAPQATFQSPTNGMQNVSVSPTITITTNYPIDMSSLQLLFNNNDDSTLTNYADPTLTLLFSDMKDSLPDTLWRYAAIPGTFSTPNSTTITFQPWSLAYGEVYYCYVKGLRVIDGGGDTVSVPVTSISFRTVEKLPYVINSSLDQVSDLAKCNTPISVTFSKKMSSHTTVGGNLLELQEITGSSAIIDTFYTYHTYSSVATTSWVNPADSTVIYIQPSAPLTPGARYLLSVKLSRLTGDSLDNRQQVFRVKAGWRLNLQVTSASLSVLPAACVPNMGTGELYLPSSSANLTITVPAIADSVAFKEWLCPQDIAIAHSTSPTLTLAQGCNDLLDRDLIAVYDKITKVNVTVVSSAAGGGDVYVLDEGAVTRPAGTFPIYTKGEDRLVVSAFPGSGYVFSGWISSNPTYNGLTSPTIIVRNITSNMTLQPSFAMTPCTSFSVCTSVMDENGAAVPGAIFFRTPNPCQTSNAPFTASVTGIVMGGINSCYRIVGVVATNGFIWPNATWDWDFSSNIFFGPMNFTTTLTNCDIQITFIVAKRSYILTDEIEITNNFDLPVPYNQYINNFLAPEGMRLGAEAVTQKNVTRKWKYKCGTVVDITPWAKANSGYSIDYWECGSPYTCNSIVDATKKILRLTMDQDWKIKHYYKADDFRVTNVGFKRGGTITWYPIDFFISNVPADILLPANSNKTVEMYVRFNKDVNHSTVPGNLKAKDFSDRIDRCDKLKRNYDYSIGMNGALYDSKTVQFVLKTSALSGFSTYMEMTQVDITAGIKSSLGLTLANPRTIFFETRMPGVTYTLNSLYCGDDTDPNGSGEIRSMIMMAVGKYNATGTPSPYQVKITNNQDVNSGDTWNDPSILLNVSKLWSKEDQIAFGAMMWDEDNYSLTDRTGSFSNSVRSKLSQIRPDRWIGGFGPGAALYSVARPYSFYQRWWSPWDDEIVDGRSGAPYAQALFNRWSYWGATCTGSNTSWYKSAGNRAQWNLTVDLLLP